MTIARADLCDPAVTRWYHCITRYVRRAFVLGEGAGRPQRLSLKRVPNLGGCAAS